MLFARRQLIIDGDAGIVHQHVETGAFGADGFGGSRHAVVLRDIKRKPLNVQAFGAQFLRCRHAAFGIPGAEPHLEAHRRQSSGNFAADALVGAGNHSGFRRRHFDISICPYRRLRDGAALAMPRAGTSLPLA
jgi:hypothetical protein